MKDTTAAEDVLVDAIQNLATLCVDTEVHKHDAATFAQAADHLVSTLTTLRATAAQG